MANPFASGTRPWTRMTEAARLNSNLVLSKGEFIINDIGDIFVPDGTTAARNLPAVVTAADVAAGYVPLGDFTERAQDAFAALIAAGTHTGISFAYDDAGNRINVTVTGGGSSTGTSTGGTSATVNGASVSTLAFTTSVSASDVGALPLPSGTPTVGQAPVVTTVSPLAMGWGSAGSGSSSGSVSSSSIVTNYGAKGDGVMLTDLTVTAGSKTISSAVAPFTNTATDAGKIVIWLTGATTEVGTIATVQSTTQATLVNNAVANSVAFGGPNGNGAIGTDNTTAINNALAAAQAQGNSVGSSRRYKVAVPRIHFPTGVYLTRTLNPITMPGGLITGDGMWQTFIVAAIASGNLFQHGTFVANPQDAFQGTGTNWTYRDMHIVDATRISTGTENQRTVNAIVDYGCGNIRINNVAFRGLKYGFAGAHGSDFSDVRDCFFEVCDVGSYFGPGSQQVNFSKTDWANCREMAVFEGAPHWHIGDGSSFEDPTVAAIVIEAKSSGTTRFGMQVNVGGAFYNGNFIVDGSTWFETNAGNNGRIAPRMILFTGDGPFGIPAEGLTLRDCYVVSGGTQQSGGTVSFVEFNSAYVSDQPVIIEGLYLSDPSYINTVFRATGSASTAKPLIKNIRKPSNVSLTLGNVTPKIINRDGTFRGFTSY